MRVIRFIEDEELIKKIFKHLGLWERMARPLPQTGAPQQNGNVDKSYSQVPVVNLSTFLIGSQNMTLMKNFYLIRTIRPNRKKDNHENQ